MDRSRARNEYISSFKAAHTYPLHPIRNIELEEVRSAQHLRHTTNIMLRPLAVVAAVLSWAAPALCEDKGNLTTPLSSRQILPATFKPPQTFKNANLVHIINLERSYARESINTVIENISKEPQSEYYLPFTSRQMETLGGFEAKDRKNPEGGLFKTARVEYDPERCVKIQDPRGSS